MIAFQFPQSHHAIAREGAAARGGAVGRDPRQRLDLLVVRLEGRALELGEGRGELRPRGVHGVEHGDVGVAQRAAEEVAAAVGRRREVDGCTLAWRLRARAQLLSFGAVKPRARPGARSTLRSNATSFKSCRALIDTGLQLYYCTCRAL